MARTKKLGVWLEGQHVADLESRRWNDVRCRYTEAALARWSRNDPVLSCSLPVGDRPLDARAFCIGLLPEGKALEAMARRAGVSLTDTFGMLERYGRDVAGALVIAKDPPDPPRFGLETYTDDQLAEAVDELDSHPLGTADDSELSLAGLQDKLLLVRQPNGSWARPLYGRPSTHILKRDDARHPGLVVAEGQCLALARAVGLTTIDHEIVLAGDEPCLIVARFDRELVGADVRRLHQEDTCQALGINPRLARGRAKYEDAGGPGFAQVAGLLDAYAGNPAAELSRLVAVVTFTVLIGNADAHGKNLALLHGSDGTVALAPLYDTVPTVLWPKLRPDAAMAVGGRRALDTITLADIVAEASGWPYDPAGAERIARDTITRTLAALDGAVIPERSDVAQLVRLRAARLMADGDAGAAGR